MDDTNRCPKAKSGYFRASLGVGNALAEANPSVDLLAAWLVLRRHAFGPKRQYTAAGAKRIASALGITRYRAAGLLRELLALCYGARGEQAFIVPAKQWNADNSEKVPPRRGNADVYVMPEFDGIAAYLPDALMPPGDTRSWLADVCDAPDPQTGLDAMRLLLYAYAVTSCGDYLGADPTAFAFVEWLADGDRVAGDYEFQLGRFGSHGEHHYWLVAPSDKDSALWPAIEAATGGRTETHAHRFWVALRLLTATGLLYRAAIVTDARGRLLYPLWVFGASHRESLAAIGIRGDLASGFHRKARKAGFDNCEDLRMAAVSMEGDATDIFVCATASVQTPIIRTVFVPTLIAPTPQNMAGLATVARRAEQWA